MTKNEIVAKNLTLSFEFSRYLLEHPEFGEQLPEQAQVVLLPKDDPELYRINLELAFPQRELDYPVVFIEIEALAPARSRLIAPCLVEYQALPAFA